MGKDEKLRPFYCGTQRLDWQNLNCCRCTKYSDEGLPVEDMKCEIGRALSEAAFGDGTVSREIAERMGFLANEDDFLWECGEIEFVKGGSHED